MLLDSSFADDMKTASFNFDTPFDGTGDPTQLRMNGNSIFGWDFTPGDTTIDITCFTTQASPGTVEHWPAAAFGFAGGKVIEEEDEPYPFP